MLWRKIFSWYHQNSPILNIFEQSPANGADYRDPDVVGAWPRRKGTWLQMRMAEVARMEVEDNGR